MKVDNFALEQFACPARYQLRMVRGLVPIRKQQAPSFGAVVHTGLAAYYRTGALTLAQEAMRLQWPEVLPSDDYRTLEYALTVVQQYTQQYPIEREAFRLLQGADGPLVEQTFSLDTGLLLDCEGCGHPAGATERCVKCSAPLERIIYGGILDAGVEWNGQVYVLDHKTSSRFGENENGTAGSPAFFQQFRVDGQMTGYLWALGRLTNRRVGGAIVNGIGLYRTGRVTFGRGVITRTAYATQEWLRTVQMKCQEIRRAERTGEFRLETTLCVGKYGACPYLSVHELGDAEARERRLATDYVKSEWDWEQRDD